MLRGIKLSKKISGNTITIILVSLILGGTYFFYYYKSLDTLVRGMLTSISNQGIVAVKNNIDKKIERLVVISNTIELSDPKISDDEKLKAVKQLAGNSEDVTEYLVIGTDGLSKVKTGAVQDFSQYSFFRKAINNIPHISGNLRYYDGSPVSVVAVPNYSLDGEIIGVLAYAFPVAQLENLVKNISIVDKGTSLIVSRDGSVVAGGEFNGTKSLTGLTKQEKDEVFKEYSSFINFLDQIGTKSEGYGEYRLNKVDNIAIFQEISGTDWYLVSTAPKNMVYSDVYKIFATFTVGVLAISVIIFLQYRHSRNLILNLEKEKQKSVVAVSLANLITVDLDKRATIVGANENFLHTSGYDLSDLMGNKFERFIPVEQATLFKSYFEKVSDGVDVNDMDVAIVTKNGELVHVLWSSSVYGNDEKQDITEFIGTNITKLKDYQKKIHKLAYYDSLTDLKNRTSLEEFITAKINEDKEFSILYLDFDNFKLINDSYGHNLGNKFIIEVAKRILVKKLDNVHVFKIGGDEIVFVYLSPEGYGEVGDYGNSILNTISEDYFFDEIRVNSTASMGISMYPNDGHNFEEIFKAGEIALNKAKELGKARVAFYNHNMNKELLDLVLLEDDLKKAVKNEEFILYYQPQYDIESGDLCGFEALIRWISPTRGFVPPGVFINAVEKNKLIIPIGQWALETASVFAKEISPINKKAVPVSVNVSISQITSDDYVSSVLETLDRIGVNFEEVKLELTESVLMDSIDINLIKINDLHKKGLKFALDDFGTGYSSLTYLKKLPIQLLKIDKSFVDTILDDKDEEKEILSTIITLAHNINIKVVAEGVEEKVQLDWLRNKGCNICQGYYTGRPLPEEEALKVLNTNIYTDFNL